VVAIDDRRGARGRTGSDRRVTLDALIRTNCPECGMVELPVEAVIAGIELNGEAWYAFCCPEHLQPVTKTADTKIINLLEEAGVLVSRPIQVETHAGGPPLTLADMIEFDDQLDREDYLAPLADG
jgi:hypothetical protein